VPDLGCYYLLQFPGNSVRVCGGLHSGGRSRGCGCLFPGVIGHKSHHRVVCHNGPARTGGEPAQTGANRREPAELPSLPNAARTLPEHCGELPESLMLGSHY
jgi:hypothetical protein